MAERVQRRLAAIVAADVAGYSRLIGADEEGTLQELNAHRRELIDHLIDEHGGRIANTAGDSLLLEFPSAVEAVRYAINLQDGMSVRNRDLDPERQIKFRIGINVGDVVAEGDDLLGDGVNVAARLESLATPGGICLSRTARDQVRDRLDSDFEDMGEVEVKNIDRPLRVFRVVLEGTVAPTTITTLLGKRVSSRWRATAAGVLAFVTLAAVVAWWQPWRQTQDATRTEQANLSLPDKPSIVVLPFANLSNDPEQEYLADGMTDDLITDLSKVSGVFVISRNSAFTYKGKAVNVLEVARELGVRYVLEGSVRRLGKTVRINAQLVDGVSGGHVWADRYDGTFDDIFVLQDKVIEQIVAELKVKLTSAERAQIARIPTSNLEAYDNYMRAEQEGYYVADAARYRRTLAFYRTSIELDPEFADAYAGYARALIEVMRLGYDDVLPGLVARQDAYNAAGRALAFDPENARAFSVLALLQVLDGRHDEAIASANRAVSLSPNSAEAKINLGLVLSYAGQPTDAVAEVEAALRLNPKPSPGINLISGIIFYFDRQYLRAITALNTSRADQPTSEIALEFLAGSYAHLGDLSSARTIRKALLESFPGFNLAYARLREQHYKRKKDINHHMDGLEKAGVAPWPYGYKARPADRLTGSDLEAVIFGKLWNGTRYSGVPFTQEISEAGAFAYSSAVSLTTGTLWIDGDQVCHRIEGYFLGRAMCGYIYRNTDKEREAEQQYVYVAPDSVRFFSVSE